MITIDVTTGMARQATPQEEADFLAAQGGTQPQLVDPLTIPLDRLQFWLVAASAGISKWSIRDRIAAMPEGVEKNEAIAWYEDSPIYRREDPLLTVLAEAEGVTSEQLDALWAWGVG